MFDVVYFSSVSENTKRFVDKLGHPSFRIPIDSHQAAEFTHDKESILVTPTHIGFIKSLNLVKVLTPASEIASLDPAPSKPLILAKAGWRKFEKKNQKFKIKKFYNLNIFFKT